MQFDDIAKRLFLGPSSSSSLSNDSMPILALQFAVTLDERENGEFLFLGSPVFGVSYGQLANKGIECRSVLGGYDEHGTLRQSSK